MSKHHVNRKNGAAIITAVIFFVVISVTMAVGLSSPVVREYVTARDFEKSKGAYYLSEAGMEDAVYRLRKPRAIDAQEVISLGGNTATTTITTVSATQKTISSLGDIFRNTRRVKSTITTTTGESFVYGVWAGQGGVRMNGNLINSYISGNLYSIGPICGGGSSGATCTGGSGASLITGTVISGGTSGLNGTIGRIQNQGDASMYAGTIKSSTISGVAYCNTISGSSTSTCQTLPVQPPVELPITRGDIENWEAISTAGGSVTCTGGKYYINGTISIGPKKIPCDLETSGSNYTITLTGPIWVEGDIKINNNQSWRVDPSLVGQSIMVIADKQTASTTAGTIEIENNPVFSGAPGGNSWVMLLSENTGASIGADAEAIWLENNVSGALLLYARLGDVKLQNNSNINEVTAYQITLENNAVVNYLSGLQNTLFTSGPGGAWYVQGWKEGQ